METPTRQILAATYRVATACDAAGRTLTLRELGALDRLRLFKAVGPELAENTPYLGMALLAISVTAIDGVPVPPPVTESQIEGLVQRLGDDGLATVSEYLNAARESESERIDPGN